MRPQAFPKEAFPDVEFIIANDLDTFLKNDSISEVRLLLCGCVFCCVLAVDAPLMQPLYIDAVAGCAPLMQPLYIDAVAGCARLHAAHCRTTPTSAV